MEYGSCKKRFEFGDKVDMEKLDKKFKYIYKNLSNINKRIYSKEE
jgi:hypothetical protein